MIEETCGALHLPYLKERETCGAPLLPYLMLPGDAADSGVPGALMVETGSADNKRVMMQKRCTLL